ncbi:hypothetical protein DFJ58DRAFT_734468 [Suillus subalutaceus]|uniref:uncharacterized protein n=1 Tax=Suillus subalutaceus TaxID=48586 RepID=UPI001B883514|nr:uncharacterized protein DFJ58DRAFT_734468 [Suillus subalutaceus]KAG1837281.1 hypothetical protein DFJ58DRAFT_734468 [Suillus subalutaceus]
MKNMVNRLFSRSSAPQRYTRPRRIPLVDVFATQGKYRTANTSGKGHLLVQPRHPPRQQAHAGASISSTPPTGTSNVIDGATPATLQIGSTSTVQLLVTDPLPLDVEYVPDSSAVLQFS